jgi:2-polyprenyl-6-methoxyphenol hydroxylase-like FAD-dependent oxidoreductase
MKDVVVIGAGKIGATVAGLLASTGDYQVTLAGAKVHQSCWQEGPRTGAVGLGIRLGSAYPPAYPSWPDVIGACSD